MTKSRIFFLFAFALLPLGMIADNIIKIDISHPTLIKNQDSIKVTVNDSLITVNNLHRSGLQRFLLTGNNSGTSLCYKGKTKASFTIKNLTMRQLFFENKKHNTLLLPQKSVFSLSGGQDTTHRACIFSSGNLTIKGEGSLLIDCAFDGIKGIYGKKNIHIKGNPVVKVHTTGNNLGVKPDMGPFGGGFGGHDFDGFEPDSAFMAEHPHPDFHGMGEHPEFPDSDFIAQFPHPDFHEMGGHPEFPDSLRPEFPDSMDFGPMMGGGPMKQKYYNTTKGIKALGTVTIDGGTITVTTTTAGAEGIEGKKGVTLAGGTVSVDAQDDGINSGGKIIFSGADVSVISRGNDAVDSNGQLDGAITISGGNVFACSLIGTPEEGLDCDFSPIVLTGGIVLSMGGSMGPDGSSPTAETATQPYSKLNNIRVQKGQKMQLVEVNGKVLYTATMPAAAMFTNVLISAPTKVTLK